MVHFWSRHFKFPRFVYHNELDRRIWNDDKTIKPMAHDAMLLATGNFIRYIQSLGFPLKNSDIIDILLYGSITDFYYDNTSYIDVCIVANLDNVTNGLPGLDIKSVFYAQKHEWHRHFKISICGRGFNVNVIDANSAPQFDGQFKPGPIYSILHNQWRREPTSLAPAQVRKLRRDTRKKFRVWKQIYKRICRDNMGADFIEMFLGQISSERTHDFKSAPITPMSDSILAYRMMRNCGYVRDMRIRAQKYRAKNFNVTSA